MSQPTVGQETEPGLEDLGGKYRLLLRLGQGGAAFVHLAVVHGPGGFNKLVVVKTPKPEVVLDPESRRMFRDEARLAARLNHANIAQTNEIAEARGSPMIVMEYLDGQPFSAVLARDRSKLTLAMQLHIVSEALSGLHYAHECMDFDGTKLNVVHRDISPQNIFITFDGQVKILDFGIAKLERSEHRTASGVIKGKLRYMPPEQIAGENMDRRADVFAVGCILWDIIAGQELWKGKSDRSILNRVLNGEIPSPSEINPDASPELVRICMKALAEEPSQRYASAAELQVEIEAVVESLGTPVAAREIGKIVATMFATERAETKRVIEARLGKVAGVTWAEDPALEALLAKTEDGMAQPTRKNPSSPRSKTGRAGVIAVGVALLLGVLLFWSRVHDKQGSATVPSSSVELGASPIAAAPIASAPTVSVQIAASPADATLFLDDVVLPSNPFSQRVPKDDKPHRLRVEAPDSTPVTTSIGLDKDVSLVITLEAAKVPAKERAPVRTAPRLPTTPITKPQCSPNYYFDDQGTKKFKPECF